MLRGIHYTRRILRICISLHTKQRSDLAVGNGWRHPEKNCFLAVPRHASPPCEDSFSGPMMVGDAVSACRHLYCSGICPEATSSIPPPCAVEVVSTCEPSTLENIVDVEGFVISYSSTLQRTSGST